jgi:hypothetical protein
MTPVYIIISYNPCNPTWSKRVIGIYNSFEDATMRQIDYCTGMTDYIDVSTITALSTISGIDNRGERVITFVKKYKMGAQIAELL